MQKKEDLIAENIELRARLELAEKWMRREIQGSISKIQKEHSKKGIRQAIWNVFENEWIDILTRRILTEFTDSLTHAPKYTLERLIDAEIYWNTLQKYPQMDALPIVLAYQKILDAWIESTLISWWRIQYKNTPQTHTQSKNEIRLLEDDITHVWTRKYTLSIGRLYQIISYIRKWEVFDGNTQNLISYWKREHSQILDILVSDVFFELFTELIDREVFTRKRHEAKVNYTDAKVTREIMIDRKLLFMLFS